MLNLLMATGLWLLWWFDWLTVVCGRSTGIVGQNQQSKNITFLCLCRFEAFFFFFSFSKTTLFQKAPNNACEHLPDSCKGMRERVRCDGAPIRFCLTSGSVFLPCLAISLMCGSNWMDARPWRVQRPLCLCTMTRCFCEQSAARTLGSRRAQALLLKHYIWLQTRFDRHSAETAREVARVWQTEPRPSLHTPRRLNVLLGLLGWRCEKMKSSLVEVWHEQKESHQPSKVETDFW